MGRSVLEIVLRGGLKENLCSNFQKKKVQRCSAELTVNYRKRISFLLDDSAVKTKLMEKLTRDTKMLSLSLT